MQDSNAIKELIKERARELDLELADLSKRLGKKRGYLHDYLERGSPKAMPVDLKIRLATELKIPPHRLGVSFANFPRPSGRASDVEPVVDVAEFAHMSANMAPFRVLTNVLDKSHPKRILPGEILIVNMDEPSSRQLARGDIIIAYVYDRAHPDPYATVLREFIPPDFLATTSSGPNEIMALNDPDNEFRFEVVGVVHHQYLPLRRP
ncbi:hypothetical protein Hden_1173 [Hyphomicrobium denitrificans ATCC 51888]|uniref:Phage repressor n=1 Tax=Hyphomicrobium denitrificans (strain ATCC 51888 / DSM 1869 / NCIMB 11706 / TK 0415) TaxID=582899 RepID=D8JVU7_HYPDA|nr:helix-turn-helix transcriptional regulator [Hyphomicrobium denitrificans]ADJ22986.1 hypothetical protein Hden_1173 [Hyphomicrobium denitrificans ATCC 51888]